MDRPLVLTTYLGANTEPIVVDLARLLTAALGIEVRFEPERSWAERRAAIDAGEVDLLWMCGLATVEAIDAGRLEASIVAAPVFPEQTGPTYRSVVVARPSAPPGLGDARVAINERSSWSGYHALRLHRPDEEPAEVVETGSHAGSMQALLDGRADIAAIDETIWTFAQARDERLRALVVVDRTPSWPAPPFSVAARLESPVRERLVAALLAVRPAGLERIVPATDRDYDPIRAGLRQSLAQPAW